MDGKWRSLLKTVTWRICAFTLATLIAYIFSRDIEKALYFSLVLNAINMVVYYFHERVWNKISIGRRYLEE